MGNGPFQLLGEVVKITGKRHRIMQVAGARVGNGTPIRLSDNPDDPGFILTEQELPVMPQAGQTVLELTLHRRLSVGAKIYYRP